MAYYNQCKLVKQQGEAAIIQVAYIPSRFAVTNEVIKIRDEYGVWENGWVVKEVWTKVSEELLPYAPKAIRMHRQNTGDALPKVK